MEVEWEGASILSPKFIPLLRSVSSSFSSEDSAGFSWKMLFLTKNVSQETWEFQASLASIRDPVHRPAPMPKKMKEQKVVYLGLCSYAPRPHPSHILNSPESTGVRL